MGETLLDIAFEGPIVEWRGPPPYLFVAIPPDRVEAVRSTAPRASYGWGCIPVEAEANGVPFSTALMPKDGGYLLPLKAAVRAAAELDVATGVRVRLAIADR